MRNILVIGAGGHAKVVIEAIQSSGLWKEVAILDDMEERDKLVLGVPVIGKISEISKYAGRFSDVIVAIGDGSVRLDLLEKCAAFALNRPAVVHPKSHVAPDVSLGGGTVVFAGAIVNSGTMIGDGCIINTGASVDHDCVLDDGVHVCPGARLAGGVMVGRKSWIGIGSSIIQNLSIGHDSVIGAGAAVIGNVPDSVTVVGVPARPISTSAD